MPPKFIRCFNKDNVPVYVEIGTGACSWLLPPANEIKSILQYVAHISDDDGEIYYEDIVVKETDWEIPGSLSSTALAAVKMLRCMNTKQSSSFLKEIFDSNASRLLADKIDQLIEASDDGSSYRSDSGSLSSSSTTPWSPNSKSQNDSDSSSNTSDDGSVTDDDDFCESISSKLRSTESKTIKLIEADVLKVRSDV